MVVTVQVCRGKDAEKSADPTHRFKALCSHGDQRPLEAFLTSQDLTSQEARVRAWS